MVHWQQAEAINLGPAAAPGKAAGGKGLGDYLYSWPDAVNPCRVDQELVSANYQNPTFFDTAHVDAFGLAALEYLLFGESPQNSCPATATINTAGTWSALSAAELAKRRADYAKAAALHLEKKAAELLAAWEPSGGNFLAEFQNPGGVYATPRAGVDELFAGLFHVDLMVKDRKLALPSGIDVRCVPETCPELLESKWAHHSGENVAANLRGFLLAFTAGDEPSGETDGLGFDDYLKHRGAPELAASIIADSKAAIASAEALTPTLEDALATDVEKVRAVHAAVKKITDQLKSQMVTVLNLRVPDEGASDND
jgi:predicted lipoprotein